MIDTPEQNMKFARPTAPMNFSIPNTSPPFIEQQGLVFANARLAFAQRNIYTFISLIQRQPSILRRAFCVPISGDGDR
jgi:hypothetical protein